MRSLKSLQNKEGIRRVLSKLVPYVGLLLLILVAILTRGNRFLAVKNLRNLLVQSSILIVMAVGSAFIMSHGDMDFANGGTMGLAMVFTIVLCKGIPAWAYLPVCLVSGLVIGTLIGMLTTKLRVVAFIVGMCIMRFSTAILYTTTQKTVWLAPAELSNLNKPWFYIVTCVLAVAVGWVVFEFTKIGQYNKAIGVNQNAARLSGIHVKKYLLYSFAIGGLCAGLCAFMMIVRTGGLSTSTGSYEVDVLIALTIGGMPLTGGSKASIRAAVIGGLALIILNNLLILLGVKPDFVNVIKGIVFLTLVLVTSRNKSGSAVTG